MCKAFERAVITHCAPTWPGTSAPVCSPGTAAKAVRAGNAWRRRTTSCKARESGCWPSGAGERHAWCWCTVPRCWSGGCGTPRSGPSCAPRATWRIPWKGTCPSWAAAWRKAREFPHEIGVFLDYPLEDVQGFMANGGAGAVCQGCWKAYGDAQEAYRRFRLYGKCREVYLSCYRRGFDVLRLTVAA